MEDYIAISALQHYVFCPRQCSLIWMENKWEDNMFTVQGTLFHKRVDSGIADIRCNKN